MYTVQVLLLDKHDIIRAFHYSNHVTQDNICNIERMFTSYFKIPSKCLDWLICSSLVRSRRREIRGGGSTLRVPMPEANPEAALLPVTVRFSPVDRTI